MASVRQCSNVIVKDAFIALRRMATRSVVDYSKVIHKCVKTADIGTAERCYNMMVQDRVQANTIVYCNLISVVGRQGNWRQAVAYLESMEKDSVLPDSQTFNAVLNSFLRCSEKNDSKKNVIESILNKMDDFQVSRTVVTYNILCSISAKSNDYSTANDYLTDMKEKMLSPDLTTLNSILSSYKSNPKLAAEFLETFTLPPDVFSYSIIISSFSKVGSLSSAVYYLERMREKNVKANVVCYNALISCCAKSGDVIQAEHFFRCILEDGLVPTVHTYSSMIDCCSKVGSISTAIQYLEKMKTANVKPNIVCYNALISCCGKIGDEKQAEHFFGCLLEEKLIPTIITYTSLIDCCAKVGNIAKAEKYLNQMTDSKIKPDLQSLGSVLHTCTRNGDAIAASKWLGYMQSVGITLDSTSFNCVIAACAQTGLYVDAISWLEKMKGSKLQPDILSYTSALQAVCYQSTSHIFES